MAEITDPDLLKQLNSSDTHEVSDPNILTRLNAPMRQTGVEGYPMEPGLGHPDVPLYGAMAGAAFAPYAPAVLSPAGRVAISTLKRAAPFAAGAAAAKGGDWAEQMGAPKWIVQFLKDYSLGSILKGTEGKK